MMRYLRLYLHFLRFSFSKALEFRLDFSFRIVMDTIYYLVNILFFKVLYLHTGSVGGWSENQMMVFVATYLMVDALSMTIVATNLWWLPTYINRGDLDYYLIRPVSPLFFLSLKEFSANSFINLLMAICFFAYSLSNYELTIQWWGPALLVMWIFLGTFLYYVLYLLFILPVFWTQSAKGYGDLFNSLGIAMERPDGIYRGLLRKVMTIFIPFAVIASFPARLFIDGFSWPLFGHFAGVIFVFGLIALTIWKRGLKNYSSASS